MNAVLTGGWAPAIVPSLSEVQPSSRALHFSLWFTSWAKELWMIGPICSFMVRNRENAMSVPSFLSVSSTVLPHTPFISSHAQSIAMSAICGGFSPVPCLSVPLTTARCKVHSWVRCICNIGSGPVWWTESTWTEIPPMCLKCTVAGLQWNGAAWRCCWGFSLNSAQKWTTARDVTSGLLWGYK